eukprot:sb/3470299/
MGCPAGSFHPISNIPHSSPILCIHGLPVNSTSRCLSQRCHPPSSRGVPWLLSHPLRLPPSLSEPESKHIILLFLSLIGCNVIGAIARFYREISSLIRSIMPERVGHSILHEGMLHDVVLCRDAENVMRNLPIKMMEPVSILFADLVGFTAMSSTLEAAELVSLLTDLYGRFDCVAEAYSCENISILGDCYFAVSGNYLEPTESGNTGP